MAASIPHDHHCFDYSTQFCSNILPNEEEINSNIIFNTNSMLPYSPVSVASFPEPAFGITSDFVIVPQMSEIETGFRDFSVCDYNHRQVFDAGEEYCSGSVPSLWPPHNPLLPENWGIEGLEVVKVDEKEEVTKVGKYSAEERKDRILRYLKKRNQRNFNKTIKYACRKTLADKRVRVRGRFAKNNEASQEEIHSSINHHRQHNNLFQHEMMKYDEEYWFQGAMENLGQFPYLGS